MTAIGFESGLDEEEKIRPIPGTNAHLESVRLKKLKESTKSEPVDKHLLIIDSLCDETILGNQSSHDAQPLYSDSSSSSDKLSSNHQPSHHTKRSRRTDLPRLVKLGQEIPITIEQQPVQILYNYCRRDRDVVGMMSSLTGDEWKVYCYLLSETHEKWEGETHCWTSHHVIREETGLGCKRTVGIVLESLEAKGLIQRTFTGNRVVKRSQYRIFLPCEMPGYNGETKLSYTRRQRDK